MKPLDMDLVKAFINETIVSFHAQRVKSLEDLSLQKILQKKNPYLFRAKNAQLPQSLIEGVLDAHISSAEEGLFGKFLEGLALFVASQTYDAKQSEFRSIDMEFEYQGVYYLIQIKSGTNWGNSSQQLKLGQDFSLALATAQIQYPSLKIQPVIASCYGKRKTKTSESVIKIAGQSFWYMLSGNADFYTDIIEPIGYQAKLQNDEFVEQRNRIIIKLTRELITHFCEEDTINWQKLVRYNSGNLSLP